MKKQIIIVLLLGLVALTVAYWFLLRPARPKQPSEPIERIESPTAKQSPNVIEPDVIDKGLSELSEQFTPKEIENLKYSHQAAQAANQNITFYGKCIDQDGNPIPDVQVTAKLTKMRKSMVSVVVNESFKYYETLTTSSDANGRFSFVEKGSYLVLEVIEKEGYLPARGSGKSFSFGRILTGATMAGIHQGDPLSPMVYTLWKKGEGSSATVLHDQNGAKADFGFSKNEMGSALYYDLSRRSKVTGATGNTMEVVASNDANSRWDPELFKHVGKGSNTAWSFTLKIPGGGITLTDDSFLFRPPESGYEENYTFAVPEGEESWISQVEAQNFYFKTADGNYGAFTLKVAAGATGSMGFRFKKLFFNPTGERNLENF